MSHINVDDDGDNIFRHDDPGDRRTREGRRFEITMPKGMWR